MTVRRAANGMGYYTKAALGVALFFVGVAGFCWGLYGVVGLATDPLSVERPPGGLSGSSGTWVAVLVGSVFVGLAGLALVAWRGEPPGARPGRKPNWLEALGIGLSSWGIFFTAAGGTALFTAFGPGDTNVVHARLTMGIVGAVFVLMGLVPLVLAVRWALSDRRAATVAEIAAEEVAPLPAGAFVSSLYETANLLGSRRAPSSAPKPPKTDAAAAIADAEAPGPSEAPSAPDAPTPP